MPDENDQHSPLPSIYAIVSDQIPEPVFLSLLVQHRQIRGLCHLTLARHSIINFDITLEFAGGSFRLRRRLLHRHLRLFLTTSP